MFTYILLSLVSTAQDKEIIKVATKTKTHSEFCTKQREAMLSEAKKFTDEEISEMKETFALFDRDGDGRVEKKDVGLLVRALGYNPTEKQVTDLISEKLHVDFHEFLSLLGKTNLKKVVGPGIDKDEMEGLREAFKMFDREKSGFIKTADLRRAMTTLGEKLEPEEVDEMIKNADLDQDGLINYDEFVKLLFSK